VTFCIWRNNTFSVESCQEYTVRKLNVRSEGHYSLNLITPNYGKLFIVGNIQFPGILSVHV